MEGDACAGDSVGHLVGRQARMNLVNAIEIVVHRLGDPVSEFIRHTLMGGDHTSRRCGDHILSVGRLGIGAERDFAFGDAEFL